MPGTPVSVSTSMDDLAVGSIALPAGITDTSGVVLVGIAENDDSFSSIDLTTGNYGFTYVPDAGGGYNGTSPASAHLQWFYRIIDGTEGWVGDGSDVIDVSGYTKWVGWHAFMVAVFISDAGPPEGLTRYTYSWPDPEGAALTPPPLTPSWDSSNPMVALSCAFARPPTSDYLSGGTSGWTLIADAPAPSLPDGDVPFLCHTLVMASTATIQPSPYVGSPGYAPPALWDVGAMTIAVPPRNPVAGCDPTDLGNLPPGQLWEGDTPWEWETDDGSTPLLVDGVFTWEPTDPGRTFLRMWQYGSTFDASGNITDQMPSGVHQDIHAISIRFRLTPGAVDDHKHLSYEWSQARFDHDDAGAGGHYVSTRYAVTYGDVGPPFDHTLKVEDINGGGEDEVRVVVDETGWCYLEFTTLGAGQVRARVYEDGAAVPTWQVAAVDTASSGALRGSMGFAIAGSLGDKWEIDQIDVTLAPPSGAVVNNRLVAIGDGVEAAVTVGAFQSGSLVVKVDGITVAPVTVDAAAGTFTLDRAPAFGAYVTATYVAQ